MTVPTTIGASMNHRVTSALAAAVLAAGLTTGLAACATGADEVSVTSGPTAEAAPEAGATLDAADFAAALKRPDTTILDVRTPEEFAQGHLPGAVNMNVEDPAFPQQASTLDPTGSYAIYCRSGNRSGVAVDYLLGQGFDSLYHLDGGIQAWEGEGGEVVTG